MSGIISVIIPTYNVGPFLAETIRSALQQTRAPEEIIIVDDCSTDGSLRVARAFDDPRIRVLQTPTNSGSAVSRNLGIETATGDLIAFLDGDDLWLDRHLEVVAGLLDAHLTAALAFSSTEAFGTEQWVWPIVIPTHEPVNCFWQCINKTIIPQMNVVVRRQVLKDIGGYRASMRQSQDFDLFLRLAYQHQFVCAPDVTTRYRRHGSSITWLKPKNSLRGLYAARHLFWLEHRTTMPPQMLARYEGVLREVWVNHLTACAARLDFDMLHFHLDQFPLIPGTAEPHRQWLRQRRIDRMKPLWMLLPTTLRNLLKKIFHVSDLQHDSTAPVASFTSSPPSSLKYDDDVSI